MYRFMTVCCLSQSEVSTDNRKVSTFFAFHHVRFRCCYRSYLDRFLIEKFLVFWRDGRLRELVAHEGSAVIN